MSDDVATELRVLPADPAADDAERVLRRASEAEFRGGVPPWVHLEALLGPAADVAVHRARVDARHSGCATPARIGTSTVTGDA
ncbi:hypothetical protein [Curtobacterium sp. B18]|uniref:hypothetical protein n=1 Tax=Curtobacterium sp. B18 TaxID=95614 RepID=UPI0011D1D3C3|nr:hypothetical protein [Curtobacterium sp. B18]